jgi:hypothetical protein
VKDGLQYMQDGKVSLMRLVVVYVPPIDWMKIDVDCKLAGQRTEANLSHSRHAYGLAAGLNKMMVNLW